MALPTRQQIREQLGIRGMTMELLILLMKWEPHAKLFTDNGQKMIYKTNQELCEELGCSERSISQARKVLSDRGWVQITVDQSSRQSFFVILWDKLGPALGVRVEETSTEGRKDFYPGSQKLLPRVEKTSTRPNIMNTSTTSTTSTGQSEGRSESLFGDKLPEDTKQFTPSDYEILILNELKQIKNWPFDIETDVKHIRDLAGRPEFKDLDLLEVARELKDWHIDKILPPPPKSSPRARFTTFCKTAVKRGTCRKPEKPPAGKPPVSRLDIGRGYSAPPEAEPEGGFVDMKKRKEQKP